MMGPMMRAGSGPKKPISKITVRRVVKLFGPYKAGVTYTTISVFISSLLGILSPFFLRIIINDGLQNHNLHIVTVYTIYSILATLGSTAFTLVFSYLSIKIGQHIMRDLRNQLFSHLQAMSLKFFTSTRTGEIQSRLTNDVGGIQSVVSDTAANVLSNLTTVASTLIAMVIMDWRLTILSVGVLPFFALLATQIGKVGRDIQTKLQSRLADLNATMQESLSVSGVLLTKVSGRQGSVMDKFTVENGDYTNLQIRQTMIFRFFFNLIGLTFGLTPLLVYWLAGYLVISNKDGGLTIGTIVAFTALQARLFFPLNNLLNVQVQVATAMALFDRIFEYQDLKLDIVDAPDAVTLKPEVLRGDVEFDNVDFRYETDQEGLSLKGVSLKARAGQLVALVGHSGAGKTTLTYLIPRLYDVTAGSVSIDGVDVRKIKLESLSDIIGMVTQETYLVHDTIAVNLKFGNPNATLAQLQDAAKAAAIHDFIDSLPDKYETVVGERGYRLSGGEKQRIAIARVILKNPRILILDEATSALDTQSERLIQSALTPLMAGRTTFAIAHRLSTILAADQILVIEKGEIVERGTHQELLALEGAYAKLYAAQFQEPEAQNTDFAEIA